MQHHLSFVVILDDFKYVSILNPPLLVVECFTNKMSFLGIEGFPCKPVPNAHVVVFSRWSIFFFFLFHRFFFGEAKGEQSKSGGTFILGSRRNVIDPLSPFGFSVPEPGEI